MVIFSQGEEDLLVTVSYGALLASYRIHWASLVPGADLPVLLQLATKPQLSLTPLQSTRYTHIYTATSADAISMIIKSLDWLNHLLRIVSEHASHRPSTPHSGEH